ncbi:hypothetical protein GCM10011504_09460 [Siccirubricoccus deserti]|uniref:Uncharacterized protein n=1 Tax=Siccirubricoccus deserti TaxID=2013562 RepID=A0A9X0UBS8_9PROT|nr:hypothetical protein [Siccirubricoccus deserti]MBC4014379.1 hypothetical protein [Siccirubricoccus deserti]GGC33316.1 hypothetical protein GCM10011504_09460 [Siccirubricoccus deserti]
MPVRLRLFIGVSDRLQDASPLGRLLREGRLRIDSWGPEPARDGVVLRTVIALDGDVAQFVSPRWAASVPARQVSATMAAHEAKVQEVSAAAFGRIHQILGGGVILLVGLAGTGAGSGFAALGIDPLALVALLGWSPPPITGIGSGLNIVLSWYASHRGWPWIRRRSAGIAWRMGRRPLLWWLRRRFSPGTVGRLLRPDEVRRRSM